MATQENHNLADGFTNRVIMDTPGIKIKACPNGAVQITDNAGNGIQIASGGAVTVLGSGSLPAGGVSSFDGRTGAVVPTSGDYVAAQVTGAAPLASPALTGTPTAPTGTPGDSSTQIATDAFVAAAILAAGGLTLATVTLTSTQVAALAVTPVQIIAAPGAGKILIPISVMYEYIHGSAVFTDVFGDSILDLFYNAANGTEINAGEIVTGFLTVATSQFTNPEITNGGGALSNFSNQKIVISASDTIAGGGTSTLKVFVLYTTITA